MAADPLSIGATLLGGFLGKGKTIKPSEQSFGHIKGLMRASKEYGINLLTLLGAGIPGGHTAGDNSAMGAAVADAGLMLADGLAKRKDAQMLNQLQRQNDFLAQRVNRMTLRPEIPGVYDRGVNTGGANGSQPNNVGRIPASSTGGPARYAGYVGREVDVRPLPDVTSTTVVTYPDGTKGNAPVDPSGEALDPWDYPAWIGGWAGGLLSEQRQKAGVSRNPLNLLTAPFWPKTGVLNPMNYYSTEDRPKPFRKKTAKPKPIKQNLRYQ